MSYIYFFLTSISLPLASNPANQEALKLQTKCSRKSDNPATSLHSHVCCLPLDPHPLRVSCNRKQTPHSPPQIPVQKTPLKPLHKVTNPTDHNPTQKRLPTQFNTLFFLQTWQNIQCRRKMSWMLLVSDLPLTPSCNKFHIQTARRLFVMNFLSDFGLHYCNNTCNLSYTRDSICVFTNGMF
jgi:hypothetical protein